MDNQRKRTFGKLLVIKEDLKSGICYCQCKCGQYRSVPKAYLTAKVMRDTDNSVRWLCRCSCGSYTTVSSNKLRTNHTKSCGCQKLSLIKAAKTFIDGTCVEVLLSNKIRANNTSGHTGVAKKGKKWQAYLTYGKKQHQLGVYASKEEAIQARERAEHRVKEHLMTLMQSQAE